MNKSQKTESLFPVFLKPEKISILVIGEIDWALQKSETIQNRFGKVAIKIITPQLPVEIDKIRKENPEIQIIEKLLEEVDFQKIHFVFVANKSGDFPKIRDYTKLYSVLLHIENNSEESDFVFHIKNKYQHPTTSKFNSSQDTEIDVFEQLENTTRIAKSAKLKSNIYLSIIGFMLLIGLLGITIYEFELYGDVKAFLTKDHYIFFWMVLVGFVAELIAGSMGMGYGVICTTILLLLNVPPPIVSASIHSAESFTTAAGSISHYKLGNINMKLVKRLAPFAILGAIIGSLSLTYFGEHYAPIVKPLISIYTLYIGANILRKSLMTARKKQNRKRSNLNFLGLVGGFIDSFAGGGWGPLVTGSLIKDGRTPRFAVGSSTLTKFLLTITSAITFIYTIGIHHWNIVLGLLIGGIVTAPFSARLTSKLPVKKMTIFISILVIIMSLITIAKSIF